MVLLTTDTVAKQLSRKVQAIGDRGKEAAIKRKDKDY